MERRNRFAIVACLVVLLAGPGCQADFGYGKALYDQDPVSFLRLAVAFLALFSIVLAWFGHRQSKRLSQLNSQHQTLGYLPSWELEKEVFSYLRKEHGLRRTDPVTKEVAEAIWKDDEAYYSTKEYLNCFERFAAAVRCGALDERYAYAATRSRLIYNQLCFAQFIAVARQNMGFVVFGENRSRDSIWSELEKLSAKWKSQTKESPSAILDWIEVIARRAWKMVRS